MRHHSIAQYLNDSMLQALSEEPVSKEAIISYYSYLLLAAVHAFLPDRDAAAEALIRQIDNLRQSALSQEEVVAADRQDWEQHYAENEAFFHGLCGYVWSNQKIRKGLSWLDVWTENISGLKEIATLDQVLQEMIALPLTLPEALFSRTDKYSLLMILHRSLKRFLPKVFLDVHGTTITAILTVWKRQHLEEQLQALLRQSHPPEQIWIYHCGKHQRPDYSLADRYPTVGYQLNSHDLGYFGRFNLGLLAKTDYLFIMDDDVIPSVDWLRQGIQRCAAHQSIISSAGRIIPPGNYRPEEKRDARHLRAFFIGDGTSANKVNCSATDSIVDYGCNSWLLKTEWLHYFWSVRPCTLETGEDIHLSAAALMQGGIRTICPRQEEQGLCGNIKKAYGFDKQASWRQSDFIGKREKVFSYWIKEKGWKPIYWK